MIDFDAMLGFGSVMVEMVLHLIPWHLRENGGVRNEHMPFVSERRASDGTNLLMLGYGNYSLGNCICIK